MLVKTFSDRRHALPWTHFFSSVFLLSASSLVHVTLRRRYSEQSEILSDALVPSFDTRRRIRSEYCPSRTCFHVFYIGNLVTPTYDC